MQTPQKQSQWDAITIVLEDATPARELVSIVARMIVLALVKAGASNHVEMLVSTLAEALVTEDASIAADKPKGGIFVMPP